MMVRPKETTIAYRCPECGCAIKSVVGVFSLNAERFSLKCPCGKSEMTVKYTNDGKVRLTVPCFICRNEHTYTVNPNVIFSDEMFYLHCMYSGVNLCFIGKEEQVSREIDEALQELTRMIDAEPEELFGQIDSAPKGIPDVSEISGIVTVIKELCADGKIYCQCEPNDGGELLYSPADILMATGLYENNCNGVFQLTVDDEQLVLECLECGGKYVFDKDVSAEAFALTVDELHLK